MMRIRALSQSRWWAAILISLPAACADDPVAGPTVTCGTGTRLENNVCVLASNPPPPPPPVTCGPGTTLVNNVCEEDPDPTPVTCGPGTMLENNECVATPVEPIEPGRFQSPFLQLQNLEGVGSHTDEVRIYGDLLINCSYTFNVIDAADSRDMEILSEGNRPVVPGDTRRPGCKHLAKDDNIVFVTHLGNNRNPAYLSGWDITEPENIVQLPVLQEPGVSYEGLDVMDHNIYVALHENGLGVYRWDTTTATPAFARIGGLGGFTNAWDVIGIGNNTVLVLDGAEGLSTVDVTDPANPRELGHVAIPGFHRDLDVNGNFAFVAAGSDGLAVVDISNLASPQLVAQVQMPGTAVRLDYEEGFVFVAAWSEVRAYDVSTPSAPRFVAAVRIPRHYEYDDPDRELPTMRIFGVAARGKDVFIGTWENPYSYHFVPDRLAPNIRLSETAARVDLGRTAPGETVTLAYEVHNQGTAPLTIVDAWISNPAFTVEPNEAVLDVDETIILTISYTAPATDPVVTADGYLHIFSDDPLYPLRKPYVIVNSEGLVVGDQLPLTSATLLDGTPWTSAETAGNVVLLTYFATF